MQPWYIATETFTSRGGEAWDRYVEWSGLTQLDEVVSLDCPTLLPEIRDDYWPHIVNEDFMLQFFTDLEFLLAQVSGTPDRPPLRLPQSATSTSTVNGTGELRVPGLRSRRRSGERQRADQLRRFSRRLRQGRTLVQRIADVTRPRASGSIRAARAVSGGASRQLSCLGCVQGRYALTTLL
jgi:hypothetical protein